MAKTKLAGAIFLIGVLLVLTIFFVFAGGGDFPDIPGLEKNGIEVSCTISMDADIFTGADITSSNCVKTGKLCRLPTGTLSIFRESFNLRLLEDGRTVDDANIDLGVLINERETVKLEGCIKPTTTSLDLELFNTETSVLEDSRTVPVR